MNRHVGGKLWVRAGLLLVSVVLLAACSSSSQVDEAGGLPTMFALPTIAPSATPTPLVTRTPSPTANPISSSATPTFTATSLLGPTSTLSDVALTLTAQATVANSLQIERFTATPTSVSPGGTVTLAWATTGGTAITLFRVNEDGSFAEAVQVDASGTHTFSARLDVATEIFLLRISDGLNLVEDELSIAISCGRDWFFTVVVPQACPGSVEVESVAAQEAFERGWAFWVEETDTIYVVYSDNQSPAWEAFEDTWTPSEPPDDPTITAPNNMFQPLRGIGKVWRTQSGVRDRLGWALETEQPFTTTFQQAASLAPDIYLLKQDGQLVHMESDGVDWEFIDIPPP